MSEAGPSARDRALGLLEPGARRAAERAGGGGPYLDLIEGELPSTGPAQDLMRGGLVPRVYERYWRPILGQLAKGALGPGMAQEIRIARLLLAPSPGDGVLDIACGTGRFSRAFATAVGDSGLVVGVDASRTMLERAAEEVRRARLSNLLLARADATALPFVDQSFDAVCCFAALHLFAEPFAALDEMRRVLTPGGRIAIMTSVRRQLAPVAPLKPLVERASGMRVFEQEEIISALGARGFTQLYQRLSGVVQFVGATLPAETGPG